jgi:hypothetical protein
MQKAGNSRPINVYSSKINVAVRCLISVESALASEGYEAENTPQSACDGRPIKTNIKFVLELLEQTKCD